MRPIVFLCLVLTACPATPEHPGQDADLDGDAAVDSSPDAPSALSVSSVLPRRGPLEGGTTVTVSGAGFEAGATVTFGGEAATSIEVASETEIVCQAPPADAPGVVDVTVSVGDGGEATLTGAFAYEPALPTAIGRCRLEGPPSMEVEPGSATEVVTGLVFAEGATEGAGQAAGIDGEVGFGPDGSDPTSDGSGWTWVSMSYQGDLGEEDRYGAALLVTVTGAHDYAVRFSADGGETWTLCDLDGSASGGYSADQAGALTVTEGETPRVDWCRLDRPAAATVSAGEGTEPIYGQVLEPGITDDDGMGRGVRAQLGVGPDGSSPAGGDWSWQDATYDGDVGDNDEYGATIAPAAPGEHDYAYRFSLDGGASWVYCDVSSSDDGYSPEDAGSLTVEVPSDPEVDWCNLQWPESTTTAPGAPSVPIFGRVYEAGLTDSAGLGTGVAAQLGWGPDGSDPALSAEWSWIDADYNADYGANDEYTATLTIADEGTYDYAYRFSLDGTHWRHCDLSGSSDGYAPVDAGSLVVAPAGPDLPEWCALWWPSTTATIEGVPTEGIYGQVYEPGLTDGVGMGAGVTAEVGWGPDGSDPEGSALWSWVAAVYNVDAWDNDEYVATIVPTSPGIYAYGYRFSVDGGTSWLYCDGDGSTDGYEPADAGRLDVAAADTVEWCNLQHPATLTVAPGTASEAIFGRVLEPGVTDSPGMGPGVTGQVGYGPDGTDPATSGWSWFDATYNVDDGASNDEYQGTLTPAASGSYDYAYRFSLDAGATWVYCDRDGSGGGYDPAQAGELTVP